MPLGSREDFGSSSHAPSEAQLARLRAEEEVRRKHAPSSWWRRHWGLIVTVVIVVLFVARFAFHVY